MKIIAELHTHSSDYCGHAFSTNEEYAALARAAGFRYLATTNHGPMMDPSPNGFYLDNLKKSFEGITFLAGMEADIRDLRGNFDLAPCDLLRLKFVIASLHSYSISDQYPDYTGALICAAENPAVDCMGHIARDPNFRYDLEAVLKVVKAKGKLIEFNNWTLKSCGRGEACGRVMERCAALEIPCVVTSDAHDTSRFADYDMILELLEKKRFPEELIVNADEGRMADFLSRRAEEKDAARKALFTSDPA